MSLPDELEVKEIFDRISELAWKAHGRISILAGKYKVRDFIKLYFPAGSFTYRYSLVVDRKDGDWGIFIKNEDEALIPFSDWRVIQRLAFLKAAPEIEERYLGNVEKFFSLSREVIGEAEKVAGHD